MLTQEYLDELTYEFALEQIEEIREFDPELADELDAYLIEFGTLVGFAPELVEVDW